MPCPNKAAEMGFFPCFFPSALRWAEQHTMFYLQAPQHSHDLWRGRRNGCRHSLIECWHSAPENEAWGSSICKETPHCYPSSDGTEHVTLLLMVSFPEELRGGCQPSSCFVLNAWSKQPGGFSQSLGRAGGWHLLTNNISLPHHQSMRDFISEWWQTAPCTPDSPVLPDSLTAPKHALDTRCHFSSLSSVTDGYKLQQALMDPGPTKGLQWVGQHDAREVNSGLSVLDCLNKRKISCDYIHNKPV